MATMTVSISQFSGGVTAVTPSQKLTACCNYLWELEGAYGIRAMAYTGGGGSVAPVTPNYRYQYYVLSLTYSGTSGYTIQDDSMIQAADIDYMLVNKTQYDTESGDFTINTATGTITSTTLFMDGDVILVPMNKLI